MKRLMQFAFVVLAATLVVPAAHAACSTELLPGPPLCSELFYDVHFAQACNAWVFSGDGATKNTTQGNSYAQLENSLISSFFEQTVAVVAAPNGGTDLSMGFNVNMVGSYPGTERLQVEIRSTGGTLLQTVASVSPSSGSGRYDYTLPSSYVGQTIKVRFRYVRHSAPGDTQFRVTYAQFFTCD